MRHRLVLIVSLLLSGSLFAQQREIDSLETLLKSHPKEDTVRATLLVKRAMYYCFLDAEKGLQLSEENIALSKRLKSNVHLMKSYNCKAYSYGSLDKDSLAIHWYGKANELAKKEKNITVQISALNNMAIIYTNWADYKKALNYQFAVLKLAPLDKDPRKYRLALLNIGVTYFMLGDYKKAADYYYKALAKATAAGVDFEIGRCNENIGLVYKNLGERERSLVYYQKAEKIFKRMNDEALLGNLYGNLGALHDDWNNPKKAESYYNSALKIALRTDNKRMEASHLSNLGILYNDQKQYDKAYRNLIGAKEIYAENPNDNAMSLVLAELSIFYLNCPEATLKQLGVPVATRYQKAEETGVRALAMIRETGSTGKELSILEKMSEIYERQGKFEQAFATFKSYKILSDSIDSNDQKATIARKEIQYEADKKQAVSQAEIERQKIIRYGTLGGSGILILSGVFLFMGFRRRQKVGHEMVMSNMRTRVLRLQMNPHFIFNSLNSISDYIAKNDITTADYFLSKFAKLMRGTLENSEETEIPLSEELKMLELYMQLEASRLNNKFTYEIRVDESIDPETTMVPPLILQPFVENSIWHGMTNKDGQGKIIIEATRDNNMLNCVVQDNGVGRSTAEKANGKSYGMTITKDRIELLNKMKNHNASVNLVDLEQGTKVEVILPLTETEL